MLQLAKRLQLPIEYSEQTAWGSQAQPGDIIPVLAEPQCTKAAPAIAANTAGAKGARGAGAQGGTTPSLQSCIWGYVLPGSSKLVYNARIESANSPLWAESFAQRRGVVPVADFFEPHQSESERDPSTGRLAKRPYRFRAPHKDPLLLAAIFDRGRISIVTTAPNEWVAPVHPRMPLALRFEEVPSWLGSEWLELANRSGLRLEALPERPIPNEPVQPSLF